MSHAPHRRGTGKEGLSKSSLLRTPRQYQYVYRRGKRIRGRHITIILADNGGDESRLGISVHGVRKAVRRNRIKRLLREFFRLNRHKLPRGFDIVFAIRREFAADSLAEISEIISGLIPSHDTC